MAHGVFTIARCLFNSSTVSYFYGLTPEVSNTADLKHLSYNICLFLSINQTPGYNIFQVSPPLTGLKFETFRLWCNAVTLNDVFKK